MCKEVKLSLLLSQIVLGWLLCNSSTNTHVTGIRESRNYDARTQRDSRSLSGRKSKSAPSLHDPYSAIRAHVNRNISYDRIKNREVHRKRRSLQLRDDDQPCGTTFSSSCLIPTLGNTIDRSAGSGLGFDNFIALSLTEKFYFHFKMSVDTHSAFLDFSVQFGTIAIFVAMNREPSLQDYDFTNSNEDESNPQQLDYLSITSLQHKSNDRFNALVMPAAALAGSHSGMSTAVFFRGIVASALSPILSAVNGLPQSLRLGAGASMRLEFAVEEALFAGSGVAAGEGIVDVLVTSFGGSDSMPSVALIRPGATTPVPAGGSYFLNTSDLAEGFLSFSPTAAEIGQQFALQLRADNLSFVNVALRVGGQIPLAQASAVAHHIALSNGVPLSDKVGEQGEHFYAFYVPPDVDEDITIALDPRQGDADLFVNTDALGYYSRSNPANDAQPATWASQLPSGHDSVLIRRGDANYVRGRNSNDQSYRYYCITVFGYRAAEYSIRVSTQNTAVLLVEGYPVVESLSEGQYRYYRFHDTMPNNDVVFDLLPQSGDADLYISCLYRPTGNDDGIPSSMVGHYNFSSSEYLEDEVRISPDDANSCSLGTSSDSSNHRGQGGVFYLAVYGYADTTYMLGALHSGSEQVIVTGIRTTSTVFKLTGQRYKLRLGFEAADLTILLSPSFGDADLFVGIDRTPEQTSFDYISNNYGTDSDSVTIKEQDICSDCWIHILVYGYSTTSYSLLASLSDGTITLHNGVFQRGSVASDDIQYYNYVTVSDSCDLVVVATMLSGGVDGPALYLSTEVERPNKTSPSTSSRAADSGDGALAKLRLTSISGAGKSIFLGVGGDGSNVTYTVRINEIPTAPNSPPALLTLSDGLPQVDSIEPTDSSDWLYYKISAPIGHESISVRIVPIIGVLDMFLLRCPSLNDFQCAQPENLPNETHFAVSTADDFTKHILTIFRNDQQTSVYLLGVHSLSYYTAYQLSSSFEHSTLALQEGIAVMDHVNSGEVDYFSFVMPSNVHEALHFTLTTISGDPDMYVSTITQHPNQVNSTWQSFDYGSDVIVIDPLVDHTACVQCTYYIAVVGATESTYTLLASRTSTLPKMIDGVPNTDSVAQEQWSYYTFHNTYGETRDLNVLLTTSAGNADLYATLDGTLPTKTNYAYVSDNEISSDQISILHDDEEYAVCTITSLLHLQRKYGSRRAAAIASSKVRALSGSGSDCLVTVGVYGVTEAEFSVTLTSSSSATLLQFGVTLTGSVALGHSQLYRAQPSARSSFKDGDDYVLRLSLTPQSGHLSMYVSCRAEQPNATNHDWALSSVNSGSSSGSGSSGFLDVPSLAAADKGCLPSTATYFAAVVGDTAATYSIMAAMADDDSAPLLAAGVEVSGRAQYHSIDYYFFRPRQYNSEAFENTRLLVTVMQGDVDIFVSASWDTRPVLNAVGQMDSFLLSSATTGSEDMLIEHAWIDHHCAKRTSCYFIVGVISTYDGGGAANPSTVSSYSILMSNPDSTTVLLNGIPRSSHVDSGRLEYFKYSLTQPNLDLVIAVTPLSGDPDLYISLAPVTHPDNGNYTWHQSKFGADTLTLQYSDIAKHCVPQPNRAGGQCDFYIGVFGWENSTFTVLAAVDEGFRAPVTLLDAAPQSGAVATGEYAYYQYAINVPLTEDGSLPIDIKFTLTPTDEGDVDLYLKFAQNANNRSADEPGRDNYDFKSTGFASVTEEIEVSANMNQYCVDCVVYLAVFGYQGGAYTLQASSDGFVNLQAAHAVGGHCGTQQYRYYRFHNTLQFAILTFTLTTISGDADLYISSTAHGSRPSQSGERWLPSRDFFTWRSMNSGTDVIHIDYDDEFYCEQCDYLIAVYGYSNSTYTLLVTDVADTIIKLVPNRPQIADIAGDNQLLYFSALITSSVADITISLTALNSGSADMFIEVYNTSSFFSAGGGDNYVLPDPSDPSTYSYSTRGTADDHVFLPGPHRFESMLVVAVQATSAAGIRFSVVATSSQFPVLLLDGVPQSHYVEHGQNEVFVFYPLRDEDLRITLTARSGDPDLFVSSAFPPPQCQREVDASDSTYIECSNYTWSSRNYMTDQIILSTDYPCASIIATTTVAQSCDPATAFQPALGDPIFIDVYGFSSAKFTILASPVGQQIQLLPGKPQLSVTSPGFICSERSAVNGACLPSSSVSRQVEVAYFSFSVEPSQQQQHMQRRRLHERHRAAAPHNYKLQHVSAEYLDITGLRSVSDVIISIVPDCNSTNSLGPLHNRRRRLRSIQNHRRLRHVPRGLNTIHHSVISNRSSSSSISGAWNHHADSRFLSATRAAIATSDATCSPGCGCNPLIAYINSCASSKCTEVDKKPSALPGQHQLSLVVDADAGSTAFLSSFINDYDSGTTSVGSRLCDPSTSKETCHYFVAVTTAASSNGSSTPSSSDTTNSNSAAFTITARTPGDSILIPCSAKEFPDGVKFSALDRIASPSSNDFHYFELCSQQSISRINSGSESLIVELEQCSGETHLFACAEDNRCVLPSEASYGFYSDDSQSCVHNWNAGRDSCIPLRDGRPQLTLPQQISNYHVMAKGKGSFQLNVMQTKSGTRMTPKLVFAGMHTDDAAEVAAQRVTGNTVTLQWRQVQVLIPGVLTPDYADDMTYSVFVFDAAAVKRAASALEAAGAADFKMDSACGLELGRASLPDKSVAVVRSSVMPRERGQEFMTHSIAGLSTSTKYQIVVMASCDGECLRQFSKVSKSKQLMSCSASAIDCKALNEVFQVLQVTTGAVPDSHSGSNDDDGGDSEQSGSNSAAHILVVLTVIFVIALLVGILGGSYFFFKPMMDLWVGTALRAVGLGGGAGSGRSQAMGVGTRSAAQPPSTSWLRNIFGDSAGRGSRSGNWDDSASSSHGLTEMVERSKFPSPHSSGVSNNSNSSCTGGGSSGIFGFAGDAITSTLGLTEGRAGEVRLKEMKRAHKPAANRDSTSGYLPVDDSSSSAADMYRPPVVKPTGVGATTFNVLHGDANKSRSGPTFVVTGDDEDEENEELML